MIKQTDNGQDIFLQGVGHLLQPLGVSRTIGTQEKTFCPFVEHDTTQVISYGGFILYTENTTYDVVVSRRRQP